MSVIAANFIVQSKCLNVIDRFIVLHELIKPSILRFNCIQFLLPFSKGGIVEKIRKSNETIVINDSWIISKIKQNNNWWLLTKYNNRSNNMRINVNKSLT